jgi:hypothetical protein
MISILFGRDGGYLDLVCLSCNFFKNCYRPLLQESLLSRKLRLFDNLAFLIRICWSSCKLFILPLIIILFVISIYICNSNIRIICFYNKTIIEIIWS